jgi:UDP-N-acetylmuramate--alanine ligase
MMKNCPYHKLYFLGIGGIGMSALARYYANVGVEVSGYDRTETDLTKELEKEGINIHYTPDINSVPQNPDLVIYTPAVPQDHPELMHFKNTGIPLMKRSLAMAQLVNNHFCIAVSGTHGKTTISSLITHILKSSNKEVLAFVGGLMKNYRRNIVFSYQPEFCVVEADEYDRSFLNLTPDIAVISAIDADHLDIYGDYHHLLQAFQDFTANIKEEGKLVIHEDVNLKLHKHQLIKYGIGCRDGLSAENIRFEKGQYTFDIFKDGSCHIAGIDFPFAGIHNVENVLAAVQVALLAGIHHDEIRKALGDFQGIHRRFDFRIRQDNLVYIDDYAHHPREIDALIKGVKGLFPGRKITGVFQPHLFSRTRDFAEEFARSLEKLDKIVVTDIYPAREQPLPGIDAFYLLGLINHPEKHYSTLSDLPVTIESLSPEILLTIGAGDIDKMVAPIEKMLQNKKEGRK